MAGVLASKEWTRTGTSSMSQSHEPAPKFRCNPLAVNNFTHIL
jgi:hypothetical protein